MTHKATAATTTAAISGTAYSSAYTAASCSEY